MAIIEGAGVGGATNIIDPKVMTEFSANLEVFNKAIAAANAEIDTLLGTPGIESQAITQELTSLKTKLSELSTKWDDIAARFNKNLNISIEEANRFQQKIQETIE